MSRPEAQGLHPIDEVVMQLAMQMLAQEHDDLLAHFHRHLLDMQEEFHASSTKKMAMYDLCIRLAAPWRPMEPQLLSQFEEQYQMLVEQDRREQQRHLDEFVVHTEELKSELNQLRVRIEAQTKIDRQKQADEMFAVTNLCRREVGTTIAMLKSEAMDACSQAIGIQSLQRALDLARGNLEATQARLDSALAENSATAKKFQAEITEIRQNAREELSAERKEMVDKIREILRSSDEERERHLKELTHAHAAHATAMEQLRSTLEDRTRELEMARQECDSFRQSELADARHFSLEKLELIRKITALETENAALKDTFLRSMPSEHLRLDSRGSADPAGEVPQIEGRLQGAPVAASPIVQPPPYRDSSQLRSPQQSKSSPTMALLRSPSETYLRLQNISSSWRERLLGSSGSHPGATSPAAA